MAAKSEFFTVQPVSTVLETLFAQWTPPLRFETLDPRAALGRMLARAPRSSVDLPSFRRSTVDGYAVRAADTFGASQSLPAYLRIVGSVAMGEAAQGDIGVGEALAIHTGGMLPMNADCVVMVERTQRFGKDELEVLAPVAAGENVVQIGEDVRQAAEVLPAGHRLRAQDIGGLLAAGILRVDVALKPRIGLLSSGDELIPPDETPQLAQIRDINAHTLAALLTEAGAEPVLLGIARDELDDFRAKAQAGFERCDMLVITAGSSVSTRDLTVEVVAGLGSPGVLQHGLAVKPGKPTIIALCEGKPVIGLPGNPVSAFLVGRQLILPMIQRFLGEKVGPKGVVRAILSANIASSSGREDTVPVKLVERDGKMFAEPVFGKSNLIFTLVNADGLVIIPLNLTGLKAGTEVEVTLF
ncbi:MAG: gephyrin-like molybdotransferase Glp [Anaerolineae bacterium]